jgi:hypothetical protein
MVSTKCSANLEGQRVVTSKKTNCHTGNNLKLCCLCIIIQNLSKENTVPTLQLSPSVQSRLNNELQTIYQHQTLISKIHVETKEPTCLTGLLTWHWSQSQRGELDLVHPFACDLIQEYYFCCQFYTAEV